MNLSFAKDSARFSRVVEAMRKEGVPLTEDNIKARYEGEEVEKTPIATVEVEATVPEKSEGTPKKPKAPKKNA